MSSAIRWSAVLLVVLVLVELTGGHVMCAQASAQVPVIGGAAAAGAVPIGVPMGGIGSIPTLMPMPSMLPLPTLTPTLSPVPTFAPPELRQLHRATPGWSPGGSGSGGSGSRGSGSGGSGSGGGATGTSRRSRPARDTHPNVPQRLSHSNQEVCRDALDTWLMEGLRGLTSRKDR